MLKHGYKGFFVKARATPAFNQTLASGCVESLNSDVYQLTRCTKIKKKSCSFSVSEPIVTQERCVFTFTKSVSANVIITIRGSGVEDGGFPLRNLLHFAIQLTGGGLVKPYTISHITRLYCIQEAESPQTIHISGVLCQIKGDLRKRNRGEKKDVH